MKKISNNNLKNTNKINRFKFVWWNPTRGKGSKDEREIDKTKQWDRETERQRKKVRERHKRR